MQFVSHSHKMAPISLGFYHLLLCIGNPDVWWNGLNREEEEEKEFFCSHPPHVGVKNSSKAGIPGSELHGLNIDKNGGAKVFFLPGP